MKGIIYFAVGPLKERKRCDCTTLFSLKLTVNCAMIYELNFVYVRRERDVSKEAVYL